MEVGRTRIAPTPSGFLHAGNAINFLLTAELARRFGARIRLRIDDLDAERTRPEYVADIFDSLEWLGINWHEGPRDAGEQERSCSQQQRIPIYLEKVELLKEQGDLYACVCTRATSSRGCDCRAKGHPFGSPKASWKLRLPADAIVRMRGLNEAVTLLHPAQLMPDPVVRQRMEIGGRPMYQIASVVDDAEHGIALVVRGEDLLPSTACQLYLAERLGSPGFINACFVHHALLTGADGRKLSKSAGADSLRAMRAAGLGPEALRVEAAAMLDMLLSGYSAP